MIVAMTNKLPDTKDWIITGRFKMQDEIFINVWGSTAHDFRQSKTAKKLCNNCSFHLLTS